VWSTSRAPWRLICRKNHRHPAGEKNARSHVPADDAHLTLEFDDHYVIRPTIQFSSIVDFTTNRLGETVSASRRIRISIRQDSRYLGIEEIIAMNDIAQLK